MEDKVFEIAKIYKITFKELGCKGLSSSYLTKIKKGHNFFKEKHVPLLVDSFNRIFQVLGNCDCFHCNFYCFNYRAYFSRA